MYRLNRIGPYTKPHDTLALMFLQVDVALTIFNQNFLPGMSILADSPTLEDPTS